MIRVGQHCHLGVPTYHATSAGTGASSSFINPRQGLRRHTVGLLHRLGRTRVPPRHIGRAMSSLQSVELFALPPRDRLGGWDLIPP